MFKEAKIFEGRTMVLNDGGKKVRVLTTPYHISRCDIPDELYVYSLIKKKREDYYMVDDMESTNADFAMSMISHVELALGVDIELIQCDMVYGSFVNMSIQDYLIETVGNIKLYVMMPTEDVASDEIMKRLNAAHRCFAIAYGRDIDDVEVLNQVGEIDPYDVDGNFENEVDRKIYRLTKKLRIIGKATHILDMSTAFGFVLRNPCCVERELCAKYNLHCVDVALINDVVKKLRKENDDLNIIMGKTSVVGTPTIPRYSAVPIPYRTPGLSGDYDGDHSLPPCGTFDGFHL
jgi:hypothetical protein